MSGGIHENWRVIVATILSVVFIVGAFVLARGVESPQVAQASTETEILKALATKDADKDGLSDWEESLYGTDPHTVDTFHLGMTDGEAVRRGLIVPKAITDAAMATTTASGALGDPSLPPAPADGSVTAMFAKSFFTLFAMAKEQNGGGDLSEAQMTDVINKSISSVSSSIAPAPDFKKAAELSVAGEGPDALKSFAAAAELVLFKNKTTATTSELNYFKYALIGNDKVAFKQMLSLAKVYRDSAAGLAALSVPREMASADLTLINALMHLSQCITDLTRVDSDTVATILALHAYPKYATNLGAAFIAVQDIYATARIMLPAGTPGASFVGMNAKVTAIRAASSTAAKR